MTAPVTRRSFLGGTGALVVAIALPDAGLAAGAEAADPLSPYLAIGRDGRVRLSSPTTEMGQGTHTAHAAIVADELGVDIATIDVTVPSPAEPYRRGTGVGGRVMSSGGSWGIRAWREPLRLAAAQAREMLIAAAAGGWSLDPAVLDIADGHVTAPDGRRSPIGELVAAAARLSPPPSPALRPATRYRYQKRAVPRIDLPAKVTGKARYSFDFKLPDMLYACARLSPVPGAPVVGRDDAAARKVAGVVDVVALPSGAAVVARSAYAAMRGAEALSLSFGPSPRQVADGALEAGLRAALADEPGARLAASAGDVAAVFAAARTVVERDYSVPFLAHAPMEPWSCTVRRTAAGLEIWAPTQGQDRVRTLAAETAKIAPDNVIVHTVNPGGGFGRRLVADGVPDAVRVALATDRPVKFFWTREDEFAQGYYRPAQAARLRASLRSDGVIEAIHIRVVGPSIREITSGPLGPKDTDWASMQNLADIRYGWPNFRYDNVVVPSPVPVAPWRAVGATHNAFFVERFMDELAAAAGMDPVAFRLKQLAAGDPRQQRAARVIEAAAQRGGWGKALPRGHARGFAYFECYGSLCAQVADVSLRDGAIRLERVTSVLDCGEVIMPDQARQQVEGGIIQGASAAMFEAITLANGAPQQRNFDGYRILRIDEAPVVDCHFIDSGERIGGVGEPPVPPAMAAISNAIARLTAKPVRQHPLVGPA